ncbi:MULTISPECIES: hypothetical protein [Pseudomonas]|uniref:Uncharacterized protein n=1 Tax=Pseudomonas marincola TaxID=437900 RepID=A0A653DZ07_9PSED|nr:MULTISPECIES: hypothetical protein [Pseudomonas]CAE6938511.1 conserved protein of unknown function [Pseudomonas marincola]
MSISLRFPPLAPTALLACPRAWPADAKLKRRRSVLFAFTFSPHTLSA